MRHILPPQTNRKRRVEELHCHWMQVTYSSFLPTFLIFFGFQKNKKGTSLLEQVYPTSPCWTLDGNPMGVANDLGLAKLDVTMVTLALATGVMEGDEGDQGGWMVRLGHLNGDLIWFWM